MATRKAKYRRSNNRLQKQCPRCKEWKDLLRDYGRRKDRTDHSQTYCRSCHNKTISVSKYGSANGRGLVPYAEVRKYVLELVRRLGKAETARRLGFRKSYLTRLWNGEVVRVRRTTAKKIMEAMIEVRAVEEVRHRKSIRRGAALRGEVERVVQNRADLYSTYGGDYDSEYRRRRRAEGAS